MATPPKCPSISLVPDPDDPEKTVEQPGCPAGKPMQPQTTVGNSEEIVITWQCPHCGSTATTTTPKKKTK